MTVLTNLKYYYLNIGTQGRGEPARLLLHDAGVPFEDIRLEFPDWFALKHEIMNDYPAAALPLLKTGDGEYHGLSGPLMRFLGRELGYDATSKKEARFVEQVSDLVGDWYQDYIRLFFQPDQKDFHNKHFRNLHIERFERLYGHHNDGPYVLGSQITYADFSVYAILRQDRVLESLDKKENPNLYRFVKEFEERKNIKEYIASFPKDEEPIVVPLD
ncbi:glutathione S-transferase [Phascolomyces articulosus]|uniref:Glutathione S-transferase n=1 Tax=Phascolomyces articulosus TaxID=60185 RepID=A0AAD5KG21_9FUNG|nr:glutathione S-transferase [Phascolomyces articulosus]